MLLLVGFENAKKALRQQALDMEDQVKEVSLLRDVFVNYQYVHLNQFLSLASKASRTCSWKLPFAYIVIEKANNCNTVSMP